jgi:hypothetical protein
MQKTMHLKAIVLNSMGDEYLEEREAAASVALEMDTIIKLNGKSPPAI